MSERPDPVHIDDLASPNLPEELLAAQREMEPLAKGLDFSVDGLCQAAMNETGLADFGADDFRERLALVIKSLEEDHEFTSLGWLGRFSTLTKYLKNRLLFEDLWKRHPEIDDVEIKAPIIIAGLPRTGTTHLHNLISSDPEMRCLPYYEALEPIPDPREVVGDGEPDPRIARCQAQCDQQDQLLPYFKRMHEMSAHYVHEEIDLLAIDVSTMFFENLGLTAQWRDWYLASDQTPHYAYLKRILKALQWMRGPERWILKSPQHLEQVEPIMNVFPDATLVFTHRDPVSIVASFATMISYSARLSDKQVDVHRYGQYWKERVKTMLFNCMRDREKAPASQSLDIRFHEYVGHDMERIEDIYRLAGQPLSDASRQAMKDYAEANPQGVNGRVIYRLEDFGLDGDELREEFRPYTDRFEIELER